MWRQLQHPGRDSAKKVYLQAGRQGGVVKGGGGEEGQEEVEPE